MLEIYVAHSKAFNYATELYAPLRNSLVFSQHRFVFPHETDEFLNSKEVIRKSNLVIAEVSYPATGLGIGLGWAESLHVPILCLYKEGVKYSASLHAVSNTIVPYSDTADMLSKIEGFLSLEDVSSEELQRALVRVLEPKQNVSN